MAFTLSVEELNQLRDLSMATPSELEQSHRVGCYSCTSRFTVEEIDQYVDFGKRALCPFCSVDAIIPLADLPHGYEGRILNKMSTHFFN